MEVILREDFLPLGYVGDTVKVTRGYARNFLIPRGMAIESSAQNDRALKHKVGAIVAKRIKKKAEAELGPLFMKLYGSDAGPEGADKVPPVVPTESGPKVEEVD